MVFFPMELLLSIQMWLVNSTGFLFCFSVNRNMIFQCLGEGHGRSRRSCDCWTTTGRCTSYGDYQCWFEGKCLDCSMSWWKSLGENSTMSINMSTNTFRSTIMRLNSFNSPMNSRYLYFIWTCFHWSIIHE